MSMRALLPVATLVGTLATTALSRVDSKNKQNLQPAAKSTVSGYHESHGLSRDLQQRPYQSFLQAH